MGGQGGYALGRSARTQKSGGRCRCASSPLDTSNSAGTLPALCRPLQPATHLPVAGLGAHQRHWAAPRRQRQQRVDARPELWALHVVGISCQGEEVRKGVSVAGSSVRRHSTAGTLERWWPAPSAHPGTPPCASLHLCRPALCCESAARPAPYPSTRSLQQGEGGGGGGHS